MGTALAITEDRTSTKLSDEKVETLKLFLEADWNRPAASALAFSFVPVEDWGSVAKAKRRDWLGMLGRRKNTTADTVAFLSEQLRGVLNGLGVKLQAAEDVEAAKPHAKQLFAYLEK